MRRILLSLASVSALALAGCGGGSDNNGQQAAAGGSDNAAPANAVTGTITLRDAGAQLSPDAKLDLKLVDVSAQGSQPLATKTVQPVTLPQQFQLDFNAADLNPNDMYIVEASLQDGERHYSAPLKTPVLTKGAKNVANIQLVGEATPGEKELSGYNSLKKNIGGLKMTQGTALKEGESRGWQIFKKGNDVQFVIELVDYGDKGFTSTNYAYKNGKPWVIVQEKKPSKDGKPTSTQRAGWNDAGELVLKQNEAGGKVDVLGDDAAAALKSQAEAMYAKAGGKK
ncbi:MULTISPECIES: YbaY family lipoprotein [Rhodanobacteraceae]|uniref:YbaY family lipoprotein n=1 Tax=Rhodanobacteraceae TaxID=1775411 RepID=UPI00056067C5|nr:MULTISPECIES: YbaY family lipoprotein [Rhodanobacteraceae]SDG94777.1 putative lipoprotein [Dyella sp. 333MFSha]SKB99714.1 putative lipoprotein [Luteibacter sp. 22Crub2.1]